MKVVIPLPSVLTIERRKKKIREIVYESEYEEMSFLAKQESRNDKEIVLSVKGENNINVANELIKKGLVQFLIEPIQLDQIQMEALRDALDNSNDDSTARFDTILNGVVFQSPIESMKQWKETRGKQSSEKNGHVNINININSNNEEIKMENKTKVEEVKETVAEAVETVEDVVKSTESTTTETVEETKSETETLDEKELKEEAEEVVEELKAAREDKPKMATWKKLAIGGAVLGAVYVAARFITSTFLEDEEVI